MGSEQRKRSLDEFLADETAVVQRAVAKPNHSHPKGWEPGVTVAKGETVVTEGPLPGKPEWADVLLNLQLDPELYQVVEPVQVRAWDTASGERLFYYKASVRLREAAPEHVDLSEIEALFKRKPARPVLCADRRALMVCLSDWQLGKGEQGGSPATIARILGSLDGLEARLKKGDYSTIVIACLGDMVESCTGHYAMQTFDVDLDRREQERAARRLLAEYVRRLAPYAPKVVVCGVPGNHGENRLNGKAYTRWSDNADVAMVEQVAEVVEGREGFEHVSFVTPDRLELTLDVEGVIVGFAHGHMSRGGADKIPAWWHRQIVGRTPLGDAQILVTGHYHHFRAVEDHGRIWLQCPSQDGGSYWFQAVSGQHAASGMLVAEVGEVYGPRGLGGVSLV